MGGLHRRINKRAVLLFLLLVALAAAFWSGSRYPDLSAKAFMGGDTILEDPLSFEVIIPLQEGDGVFRRIATITANWVNTNKKGMAFGVLMGAAALALLQVLHQRSVRGSFGNAILGMFIGAPLGVCVNCAAPIAKDAAMANAQPRCSRRARDKQAVATVGGDHATRDAKECLRITIKGLNTNSIYAF